MQETPNGQRSEGGFVVPPAVSSVAERHPVPLRDRVKGGGASPSPRPNGSVPERPGTGSNDPGHAGSIPARTTKLYAVGRTDLPPGLRAAQLTHAAITWTIKHGTPPENLVLLEADCLASLENLLRQLPEAVPFREPDLANELTAIALASDGKALSCLPLAMRDSLLGPGLRGGSTGT